MGNFAQDMIANLMGGGSTQQSEPTAPDGTKLSDLQKQWAGNKAQLDKWGTDRIMNGSVVFNNVKTANDKIANTIRSLGAQPGVLK